MYCVTRQSHCISYNKQIINIFSPYWAQAYRAESLPRRKKQFFSIVPLQIELKVSTWSRSPESTLITVSLHKAGKLAGRCQEVVNNGSAQALQCDRYLYSYTKIVF